MATRIFDFTYYALAIIITLLLAYSFFLGLRIRQAATGRNGRNRALGMSLVASGTAISVLVGVSFDILAKRAIINDLLYQQAHFSVFYVGFALVLFGFLATLFTPRREASPSDRRRGNRLQILLWALYILAVASAVVSLYNPASFTVITSSGLHYVQKPIFFLPLFVTLTMGLVGVSLVAVRSSDSRLQAHLVWLDLFTVLVLIGLLREATLIPTSGIPLVDLLLAFGPFTLASFCLLISVLRLRGITRETVS
jgi:vacuolar-type H+-ATPase subunit I/STV1